MGGCLWYSRISAAGDPIARLSFKRLRFPPDVIGHGVWLYFRFTLSSRDVEELLAQRGISASYETVRCWTGPSPSLEGEWEKPVTVPGKCASVSVSYDFDPGTAVRRE